MTFIEWDPKAREFLRKLPKDIARRIYKKVGKLNDNVKGILKG